ncbi:MAG: NAD(P)-dependent glycerol-3-phosphate dehydrogenase [Alphaproteobacteria bacterium]|nr:NAD(P)-dependent glycerol-3-phosphate dehydrogenase [Alphaproteobacteria bacterium]
MTTVSVIGGGAWGTALAAVLATGGRSVRLWARETEVVAAINRDAENRPFLPGIKLPPSVHAVGELAEAAADLVFLVMPAQHLRRVAGDLAPALPSGTPVVLCAKGMETESGLLLSQVLSDVLPAAPVAVLSGPTFAAEVARGLPTAVTVAAADRALAERVAARVGQPHFRPYLSQDVVGVQIGGALKNIIAIACGIVEGKGLGDNARAALLTRGLAEIIRFGLALGGRRETFMGLSGLGDLSLTCNSDASRNMSLGIELGRGRPIEAIMAERRSVAEGVKTASAVVLAARQRDIDVPICTAVDGICNHWADIDASIGNLLGRPIKDENG